MSNAETILFVWLGFVNGVVVFLAFERDRLLKKIRSLEYNDGAKQNWLKSHDNHLRKIYEVVCSIDTHKEGA